jgi:hypothetical protein
VARHACCIWFDRRAEVLACDPVMQRQGVRLNRQSGNRTCGGVRGVVAESGGQINVGNEVVHRRLSHGW